MARTRNTLATAAAFSLLASGCVFYPKVAAYNDPECQTPRHKLELQMDVLNTDPCHGEEALECLAFVAALGPVTLAVSGTLVLAGNSMLWLEKSGENYWLASQGRCGTLPPPKPGAPPAQEASAAPLAARAD